jgi:hypothetical protein
MLSSPVLERLDLCFSRHEATSGLLRVTARCFASAWVAPAGILVPLPPGTSRHHAGDLATCYSTL